MPDHVHIFIGLRPATNVSDIVRDVKNNSTNFINHRRFVRGKFSWQEGFGSFTHSHSEIGYVYNYIVNQEQHHSKKTFKEEYIELLNEFGIKFEEKYLFDWIE